MTRLMTGFATRPATGSPHRRRRAGSRPPCPWWPHSPPARAAAVTPAQPPPLRRRRPRRSTRHPSPSRSGAGSPTGSSACSARRWRSSRGVPLDHGEERRRPGRRQDRQGDPGRQRARRRPVVHRRQARQLLRQQGLDRPRPLHRARQGRPDADPQVSPDYTQYDGNAARCRHSPTPTGSTTTPTCSRPPATRPAEDRQRAARHGREADHLQHGRQHQGRRVRPAVGLLRDGPAHMAPPWGATWADADGKSNFSTDPDWAALLTWQKKFVDAIGYDKLGGSLRAPATSSSPRPTCSRPASSR